MRNSEWHQGITMHRLRVGAGVAGAIVVLGFLTIGLVGVPMFRYFLALAIIAGAGVALGLRWLHGWRHR
ncbi:MAG TPA: hypothetical protein VKH81_05150 [Candidatus Angelobacter sp.]|nr:hypothetical protein [Candidatus Angelobacter sp.]